MISSWVNSTCNVRVQKAKDSVISYIFGANQTQSSLFYACGWRCNQWLTSCRMEENHLDRGWQCLGSRFYFLALGEGHPDKNNWLTQKGHQGCTEHLDTGLVLLEKNKTSAKPESWGFILFKHFFKFFFSATPPNSAVRSVLKSPFGCERARHWDPGLSFPSWNRSCKE